MKPPPPYCPRRIFLITSFSSPATPPGYSLNPSLPPLSARTAASNSRITLIHVLPSGASVANLMMNCCAWSGSPDRKAMTDQQNGTTDTH